MVNWHLLTVIAHWCTVITVTIEVVFYDTVIFRVTLIVMYSECLEVKHQCFQCKVVQTNRTLQVAVVMLD